MNKVIILGGFLHTKKYSRSFLKWAVESLMTRGCKSEMVRHDRYDIDSHNSDTIFADTSKIIRFGFRSISIDDISIFIYIF